MLLLRTLIEQHLTRTAHSTVHYHSTHTLTHVHYTTLHYTKQGSICEEVLQLWATHYGAEAGVAALKYLPYGGLFLAGGMTPKLLDWIRGEGTPFMKAFLDQGRVTPLVSSIPVYAVLEEDIGQRGAHYVAFTVSFSMFFFGWVVTRRMLLTSLSDVIYTYRSDYV
jgi:glucokinase